MTDVTVHDDARDAVALIRACLDDDIDAAKTIRDNCDLGGVLAIMTGLAAQAIVSLDGETGARKWLDHIQRQESAL
jgi:hypothetical protein